MKFGKLKIYIFILFFFKIIYAFAEDRIDSVPLINLEELSPTFEEEKDELEKNEESVNILNSETEQLKDSDIIKNDKIFINLKALDKITAKTSSFRMAVGEKKFFGPSEIKALKCQISKNNDFSDTVAYLQVKDLSKKDMKKYETWKI